MDVYLCICVFVYLCTRDHVIMYLEANQCAFPWNNFKLGNRLGLKRSICDKLNWGGSGFCSWFVVAYDYRHHKVHADQWWWSTRWWSREGALALLGVAPVTGTPLPPSLACFGLQVNLEINIVINSLVVTAHICTTMYIHHFQMLSATARLGWHVSQPVLQPCLG